MIEREDQLRHLVHRALGEGAPSPHLYAGVVAGVRGADRRRARSQWAMTATAILLAIAVTACLVYVRQAAQSRRVPAGQPTGQPAGQLRNAASLDFRCTLPVQAGAALVTISLPDGAISLVQTAATGKGSSTMDAGRWLPVPPTAVAPDGRTFAYVTVTTGVPMQPEISAVFVRDVTSGSERRVWTGAGSAAVAGWGTGGLYFTFMPTAGAGATGPRAPELWAVDPARPGRAHRVGLNLGPATGKGTPSLSVQNIRIDAGVAWILEPGVAAPAPAGGPSQRTPDRFLRVDLRDGTAALWFTDPAGAALRLLGLDGQGWPVLSVTTLPPISPGPSTPPKVIAVTGAGQATTIADGPPAAFSPTLALADRHGIWFDSPGSLWLYRNGRLIEVGALPDQLATAAPGPAGAPGPASLRVTVAGPCR